MIKVVLTGSESTGKTELARQLGAYFKAPVSDEFVRTYAAQKNTQLSFADHGPIARGQMANEDAAVARANDVVFLDTDLVSTVVYCEHYFGQCPPWIGQAARSRAADLYLLLQPDVPWLPDGVRDRGDRRDVMHELFATKMREMGLRYVDIGGTWNERLERAVSAVEAMLD